MLLKHRCSDTVRFLNFLYHWLCFSVTSRYCTLCILQINWGFTAPQMLEARENRLYFTDSHHFLIIDTPTVEWNGLFSSPAVNDKIVDELTTIVLWSAMQRAAARWASVFDSLSLGKVQLHYMLDVKFYNLLTIYEHTYPKERYRKDVFGNWCDQPNNNSWYED